MLTGITAFTDLPKYKDNGTLIKYSVYDQRMLFRDIKASVTGYDITNTYKPNVIKLTQDP